MEQPQRDDRTDGSRGRADGRSGDRQGHRDNRLLAVCRNKQSTDSTRRDATRVTDRTPRCIGHGRCPLRGGMPVHRGHAAMRPTRNIKKAIVAVMLPSSSSGGGGGGGGGIDI